MIDRRSALKLVAAPALMTVARPGYAKEKVTYAYLLDPAYDAVTWAMSNGKVKSDLIDQFARYPETTRQSFTRPEDNLRLLNILIQQDLPAQAAEILTLDRDRSYTRGLPRVKRDYLATRFREDFAKKTRITDEDVMAYYAKGMAEKRFGQMPYNADQMRYRLLLERERQYFEYSKSAYQIWIDTPAVQALPLGSAGANANNK